MKILTRTYPPTINPNYGGILQAWALQQALADLGHVGYVDSTKSVAVSPVSAWLRRSMTYARDGVARLGVLPRRYQPNAVRWAANRDLFKFSRTHFRLVRLYRGRGRVGSKTVEGFDAFVVGSDQVWRPDFVDVASFLLDFLPPEDSRPRVAYAASFGSDDPTPLFEEASREVLGPLARRFDALSAREESGVELCRILWSATATRLIDPTMLLHPQRYAALSAQEGGIPSEGRFVTYVLDGSAEVLAVIDAIEQTQGKGATHLYRQLPQSYREFARHRERYRRVTVEQWLRTLAGSGSVVTDSYHGTVFAILLNKPFLVVLNRKRGLARFETLLALFGLEDRIARFDGRDAERMTAPIAWNEVNQRIEAERERGISFLRNALAPR